MSPFHGRLSRGSLRSAVVTRFFAKPLRPLQAPITRDAACPAPSFDIGLGGSGASIAVYSPRACPSLAWLFACLRAARCNLGPRGVGFGMVISPPPHGMRLLSKDRHSPQIYFFSGLVADSGLHHSPRLARLTPSSFRRHLFHYWAVDSTLPRGACTPCGMFSLDVQPLPSCLDCKLGEIFIGDS